MENRLTQERARSRVHAAREKLYCRLFSGCLPYYIVNEYPKSGGTWLAKMVAEAVRIPFRQNGRIEIEHSVVHSHLLYPAGLKNVVVLWRDPRDVLVSFYFHCYFVNERRNHLLVELMKKKCPFQDYGDVRENLPRFTSFVSRNPVSPSFSWVKFASIWAGRPNTVQTTYEALRKDCAGELTRVVGDLTGQELTREYVTRIIDNNSFAKAKAEAELARRRNTEVSFIREGSIGGWKKYCTPAFLNTLEAEGYFPAMEALGYVTTP